MIHNPVFRIVGLYGVIAGLIVALPMIALMLATPGEPPHTSAVYGYLTMIVALTAVFLGVKHYRDKVLGGVIKFGPALLVGLGISAVASLLYVIGWELSLSVTGFDFGEYYRNAMVDAARAKGASELELQKIVADSQSFTEMYRNPLFRLPMSFIEIFWVGVVISLISAGVLRNSRVLPAR